MKRVTVIPVGMTLWLSAIAMADDIRIADRPITQEERAHWAFQPVKRPPIPAVNDRRWLRNPIDAFIASRLDARGMRPSAEADRGTLIRRLSFDLTGLPPSPEEVERFLNDRSADAYDRLVDRLLASPHYGVRWAQHWLDLARYADTDGYEFDQVRPNAWRYRDWVVESLNRDMPYDLFVRLQLAGDEIAPDDPRAFIATGFNRCYPDMVDLNDQALRRQMALNDITETTGLVFLGLTIGCARCHDHKFDPIRQTDFYRLQAFFTPARFRDDYPLAASDRRKAYETAVGSWQAEIAGLQAAILRIEKPIRDRLAPGLPMGALDEAVAAYNKSESTRTPAEIGMIYELLSRDGRIKAKEWARLLDEPIRAERQRLIARLDQVRKAAPSSLPTARGTDEAGPTAPATYVLRRGEFGARGPKVEPAFPAVLADGQPPDREDRRDDRTPQDPGRLAGARRSSAHGPCHGQPPLPGSFRPGPGRHLERLRQDGRGAQPSRASRLAGQRAGRAGLEPEGHAPADRHAARRTGKPRERRATGPPTRRTSCSRGRIAADSTAKPYAMRSWRPRAS